VLNVTFSFIGGEYPEKTTDLQLIAEKLYHVMLHRKHIDMGRITPGTENITGFE
jgi:hypothetical protein